MTEKELLEIIKNVDINLYNIVKCKRDSKFDRIYDGWVNFINGLNEFNPEFHQLFKETKKQIFKVLSRNKEQVKVLVWLDEQNSNMGFSDNSLITFLAQVLTMTKINSLFFSNEHIKNAPLTKVIAPIIIRLQQEFVMFKKYLETHTDKDIEQDADKYEDLIDTQKFIDEHVTFAKFS